LISICYANSRHTKWPAWRRDLGIERRPSAADAALRRQHCSRVAAGVADSGGKAALMPPPYAISPPCRPRCGRMAGRVFFPPANNMPHKCGIYCRRRKEHGLWRLYIRLTPGVNLICRRHKLGPGGLFGRPNADNMLPMATYCGEPAVRPASGRPKCRRPRDNSTLKLDWAHSAHQVSGGIIVVSANIMLAPGANIICRRTQLADFRPDSSAKPPSAFCR
jgi:hypothetical protein